MHTDAHTQIHTNILYIHTHAPVLKENDCVLLFCLFMTCFIQRRAHTHTHTHTHIHLHINIYKLTYVQTHTHTHDHMDDLHFLMHVLILILSFAHSKLQDIPTPCNIP